MSWSLQVHNGDLALGGAQFATVTGSDKLVQDLRCYILESMGTDDMHPDYGSIIDGGIDSDGTVYASIIGETNPSQTEMFLRTEFSRIIREYQDMQLSRAKADRITYGRVTLTKGEVLYSVTNISFTWNADTVHVLLSLVVGSGEDIAIPLTISSST